jgi:hypothetical protein
VATIGRERRGVFRSTMPAVAVALVVALLPSCSSGSQWPCDRDDRANTFPGDEPGARAYETRQAAIEAWLPTAAEAQGVELSRLERSGPDRYEPERVQIYLDDHIFAEISISTPDTGEWWVVSVWACRPGSVDWLGAHPTDAPAFRSFEVGELHITNDLYERIVELCGWPK